jgi:hypothetical protein
VQKERRAEMKRIRVSLLFLIPSLFIGLSIIVIPTIGFTGPYSPIIGTPGEGFIYGDATNNNLVTADDALAITRYYVGLPNPDALQLSAADVNLNGYIDIVDALHIRNYLGDYNSLDEKLIGSGDSGIEWTSYSLINNTGEVWTDFHLRLDTYTSDFFTTPADDFYFFENVYDGPGSYTIGNDNRSIDIIGLNIGIGEEFNFNVDFDSDGSGFYGLFGQPTTHTAPIPESSTLLLLGTGLVGLAGIGRKKFFKKQ